MAYIFGFILLCIIVGVPVSIEYLFYIKWRKFLWVAPVIIVIITGFMFINDVSTNPARSFIGNVKFYFEDGTSLGAYLLYIPMNVVSLISTIVFYMYGYIAKRRLAEK